MFSCIIPYLISFHISCVPSDGGRSSVEVRGPEESDELDYLPAKHDWLFLLTDSTWTSVTRRHLVLKDQRWTVSDSDALLSLYLCYKLLMSGAGLRHRLQTFVESVNCFPVVGSLGTSLLCHEKRNKDCFVFLLSLQECEAAPKHFAPLHWRKRHTQFKQISHTQKSLVSICN